MDVHKKKSESVSYLALPSPAIDLLPRNLYSSSKLALCQTIRLCHLEFGHKPTLERTNLDSPQLLRLWLKRDSCRMARDTCCNQNPFRGHTLPKPDLGS